MSQDGAIDDDPRLHRRMRIGTGAGGYRFIEVDDEQFPTYTRGEITVTPLCTGKYRDSGELWPAHDDDVYLEGQGKPYAYEVNLTCFVDEVDVLDPEALQGRHLC